MYALEAYVLAVGLREKNNALLALPIRVSIAENGKQAVHCLRNEKVNTVLSRWKLDDMPDGMLLKQILAAKPDMPTMALIEVGNLEEEVAARSLGVSIVVDESINDEAFREMICQLLGISIPIQG